MMVIDFPTTISSLPITIDNIRKILRNKHFYPYVIAQTKSDIYIQIDIHHEFNISSSELIYRFYLYADTNTDRVSLIHCVNYLLVHHDY